MGTLHVVATPIGNLEDVTLRALRVLGEAELVFAEDTRRTRILLDRHGVKARPVSLHAHNEAARIDQALTVLRADGDVALVSDAGTPLVCDPGERLVAAAIADGHRIEALPGPSAVLTALAVSGLPALPFTFIGYLPRRDGARRKLLEVHRDRPETLVCFETPHRIAASLKALLDVLGDRPACAARELTKLHEEVLRGPLSSLLERFAEGARGEFTLVIAGAPAAGEQAKWEWDAVEVEIRRLAAEGQRPKEIAPGVARLSGRPRSEIYARAVAVVNEDVDS
jgi:16S rRNA (cytidine1402-2'-O)-methyltransferase